MAFGPSRHSDWFVDEASRGLLGGLLGASWRLLWASARSLLDGSRGPLGASCAPLGGLLVVLEGSKYQFDFPLLGPSEAVLGPSGELRGSLVAMLGASWTVFNARKTEKARILKSSDNSTGSQHNC